MLGEYRTLESSGVKVEVAEEFKVFGEPSLGGGSGVVDIDEASGEKNILFLLIVGGVEELSFTESFFFRSRLLRISSAS